jgi:hypothetical protein
MNPIVVISDNDIQVQSDLYSIDDGYRQFGEQAQDVQEYFLGDLNDYDYENATESQIDELMADAYQTSDWIDQAGMN